MHWLIADVKAGRQLAVFRQICRSQSMKVLEDQNGYLEPDPLPDWQPVKFPHHRCDAVEFSCSSDQASSSVLE